MPATSRRSSSSCTPMSTGRTGWRGAVSAATPRVRDYWQRQFGTIDSRVEPRGFETDSSGRVVVDVHQVVRDPDGELLSEGAVQHVYSIRDGLIERMEIVEEAPGAADAEAGRRPRARRTWPCCAPTSRSCATPGASSSSPPPWARTWPGAACGRAARSGDPEPVAPGRDHDLERLGEESAAPAGPPALPALRRARPSGGAAYLRWRRLPRERLTLGRPLHHHRDVRAAGRRRHARLAAGPGQGAGRARRRRRDDLPRAPRARPLHLLRAGRARGRLRRACSTGSSTR